MKSKVVKIINIDSDDKMAIEVVDDMKFSELVQAWSFMTGFLFNITEGKDNGANALQGGDVERNVCKRIFYPTFEEWAAYLKQVKDK